MPSERTRRSRGRPRCAATFAVPALFLGLASCTLEEGGRVEPVVHLADRLDRAVLTTSAAPDVAAGERSWSFTEPRPEWRVVDERTLPRLVPVTFTPSAEGTRLALGEPARRQSFIYLGGVAIDLEPTPLGGWERVLVRARSRQRFGGLTVAYNLDEEGALPSDERFFASTDEAPPVFSDGSEQVYSIPLRPRPGHGATTPLRSLGVFAGAPAPAALELVAVTLVPRGASYLEPHGARAVTRAGSTYHTLYAHTPATLTFRVPLAREGARFDFALTSEAGEAITYRVAARSAGGAATPLFEETVDDAASWRQRTLDLTAFAGAAAELTLEAASERPGAVALWGAPIVSSRPPGAARRPNVVFYVIDGAGADLMSLYEYNRRTTPYLERLAAEGVVFEHAYSNSTWTQPSTASFMTSLQHSVLGGLRRGMHSTPVPASATTMAERFRRGGYQTAAFTSNPNAGRLIGLERGVDRLHDVGSGHHGTSTVELHERFWRWREESPGAPYWVHFQTTDVHEPHAPAAPFAGLWVSGVERAQLGEWDQQLFRVAGAEFGRTSILAWYDLALERAGVDRVAYYTLRNGLHDETMAHQDYQLGRFVDRLKATGAWESTIFVVAADHGHPAGTFARFGRGKIDPEPDPWEGALFDSYSTRVPLLVVWPGRIPGGRRSEDPVSMIDVLPTLLDLAGLPKPEVAQGESLAPLLHGRPMRHRPVILDEFRIDDTSGEMIGNLEIVDGRWGASLEIAPVAPGGDPRRGRHAVPAGGRWGALHPFFPEVPRLLLYDLWNDPFALKAVNAAHPDLVERYTRLLLEHWKANQALFQRFHEEEGTKPLDPEQLRQLRALGYIQ
ncbi:MAG TPA: sulfatase [Thermoanaerobaculia bacterium]